MRNYLQEAAWRFLIEQRITSLPVNPFIVAKQNGWIVHSYTELRRMLQKGMEKSTAIYQNDGFVFWSHKEHGFVICYNNRRPFPVFRWTLFHEIGHIYLNHVTINCQTFSNSSSQQKGLFEVEANGFARRVLCPSIVLHNCSAFEAKEIADLCGVSLEEARQRSSYIKRLEAREKYLAHPLERDVSKQFEPFVHTYLVKKTFHTTSRALCEFWQEIAV